MHFPTTFRRNLIGAVIVILMAWMTFSCVTADSSDNGSVTMTQLPLQHKANVVDVDADPAKLVATQ